MANVDAPAGFRPSRHMAGGVIRANEYPMSTGIMSVGKGDPVRLTSGKIVVATAGARVLGVFEGYRVIESDGSVSYDQYYASGSKAGAVELTAFVYDDPNIAYLVQADDDTTPLPTTGAAVNRNVDLLSRVAPNANTKQSKMEVDASSLTSAVAQFRILGLFKDPDNTWAGGNETVEVRINEHQWGVTGITGES
jgi:hypothetical protein